MPKTTTYAGSHFKPHYSGMELVHLPELQEVLKVIEELRSKLNKMSEGKSMTGPEVISASHMLDAVLNEYQRLMKDKTNRS